MPYIKDEDRTRLGLSYFLHEDCPQTAGELNYLFTLLALQYMNKKGLCYQTINDIIGALEGAKAEFQRRVVGPYENKKRDENGDVY
jgi:hypothetical protein